MKTAIVYMSKHGTVEKVANRIAEGLSEGTVELFDLHKNPDPDLQSFDTVIVGGSIHMGMIQKKVKKFCEKNRKLLLNKTLGLFICCMTPEPEKRRQEFELAFPTDLRAHSKAEGILGGEFLFEKMNFLERMVVKKMAKTDQNISKIDTEAIHTFAAALR